MLEAYVQNSEAVTSETFESETVIINFLNGCYFSLGGSAPAIWTSLAAPRIESELISAFGGEDVRAAEDIQSFLSVLIAENCLVRVEVEDSASKTLEHLQIAPYVPPTVQIFHDLKELIVLDPVHEVDEIAGWPHASESLIRR